MADIIKFADAAAFERDREAWRLAWHDHLSPRQIADRLNCSTADVDASLIRMCGGVTPAMKARIAALEVERLNQIKGKFFKDAIGDPNDPGKRPCMMAAAMYLKYSERLHKLLGLDQPSTAAFDPVGNVPETSTERVRAAINRIRGKGNTVIDAVAVPIHKAPDQPEE